jgi:hypothetical protein
MAPEEIAKLLFDTYQSVLASQIESLVDPKTMVDPMLERDFHLFLNAEYEQKETSSVNESDLFFGNPGDPSFETLNRSVNAAYNHFLGILSANFKEAIQYNDGDTSFLRFLGFIFYLPTLQEIIKELTTNTSDQLATINQQCIVDTQARVATARFSVILKLLEAKEYTKPTFPPLFYFPSTLAKQPPIAYHDSVATGHSDATILAILEELLLFEKKDGALKDESKLHRQLFEVLLPILHKESDHCNPEKEIVVAMQQIDQILDGAFLNDAFSQAYFRHLFLEERTVQDTIRPLLHDAIYLVSNRNDSLKWDDNLCISLLVFLFFANLDKKIKLKLLPDFVIDDSDAADIIQIPNIENLSLQKSFSFYANALQNRAFIQSLELLFGIRMIALNIDRLRLFFNRRVVSGGSTRRHNRRIKQRLPSSSSSRVKKGRMQTDR